MNTQISLQDTKLLIWDMDNVIYPYTEEFHQANIYGAAKAASKLVPGMDQTIAIELAQQSRNDYKNPFKIFIQQYGASYDALAAEAHRHIDISFIQPDEELLELIRASTVQHALLTSSEKAWMQRIVNQTKMSSFFTSRNSITSEDYSSLKSESCHPYHITCNKVGFLPHQSLVIEDSQVNLNYAKKAGTATTWVRPSPSEQKQDYTDFVFSTPHQFMSYFNQQRKLTML